MLVIPRFAFSLKRSGLSISGVGIVRALRYPFFWTGRRRWSFVSPLVVGPGAVLIAAVVGRLKRLGRIEPSRDMFA